LSFVVVDCDGDGALASWTRFADFATLPEEASKTASQGKWRGIPSSARVRVLAVAPSPSPSTDVNVNVNDRKASVRDVTNG
jgi:hypothetical protein